LIWIWGDATRSFFIYPPKKKVNHLLALIKGAPHPETRLLAAQQMQVGG